MQTHGKEYVGQHSDGRVACAEDVIAPAEDVSLSSAEAKLHAMVAASTATLGIVSLMKVMGVDAVGEVYAD